MVDTPDGKVAIEDLKAGDRVFDGDLVIQKVMMKHEFSPQKDEEYHIIQFEDGSTVAACDVHFVEGKFMKDIKAGDRMGGRRVVRKLVKQLKGRQFDLLTTHYNGGYSVNGVHIESMIPVTQRIMKEVTHATA